MDGGGERRKEPAGRADKMSKMQDLVWSFSSLIRRGKEFPFLSLIRRKNARNKTVFFTRPEEKKTFLILTNGTERNEVARKRGVKWVR